MPAIERSNIPPLQEIPKICFDGIKTGMLVGFGGPILLFTVPIARVTALGMSTLAALYGGYSEFSKGLGTSYVLQTSINYALKITALECAFMIGINEGIDNILRGKDPEYKDRNYFGLRKVVFKSTELPICIAVSILIGYLSGNIAPCLFSTAAGRFFHYTLNRFTMEDAKKNN